VVTTPSLEAEGAVAVLLLTSGFLEIETTVSVEGDADADLEMGFLSVDEASEDEEGEDFVRPARESPLSVLLEEDCPWEGRVNSTTLSEDDEGEIAFLSLLPLALASSCTTAAICVCRAVAAFASSPPEGRSVEMTASEAEPSPATTPVLSMVSESVEEVVARVQDREDDNNDRSVHVDGSDWVTRVQAGKGGRPTHKSLDLTPSVLVPVDPVHAPDACVAVADGLREVRATKKPQRGKKNL